MIALARIEHVIDEMGFRVVVGRGVADALRIGPGTMVKLGGRDGWSGGIVTRVEDGLGSGIAVTRDVANATGPGLVALHVISRTQPADEVVLRFRGAQSVKTVELEVVAALFKVFRPPIFPGFRLVSAGLEVVVSEVRPRHPAVATYSTRFRLG